MTTLEPLLRELLGQALRSRRRELERTLADVSARAGVSMQHLSDVERGRKDASSEVLAAICGALGLSVADLMSSAAPRSAAARQARPVVLDLTLPRAVPGAPPHERAATGRPGGSPHAAVTLSAA